MAQERYWNWKDDDYTLWLSQDKVGMIEPSVYRGFDVTSFDNDMTLDLDHIDTGIVDTDLNGNQSNPKGVVVTRQGVIVKEDATISVNIDPNTSGDKRIDTVVLYHEYVETQGGLQATYSVIKGTPGAGAPGLTNPEYQVKIGELHLPDGTTALDQSGVEWRREEVPNLGNKPDLQNVAFTDVENQFSTMQLMAQGSDIDLSDPNVWNSNNSGTITMDGLSQLGNYYRLINGNDIQIIDVNSIPWQYGMRITIRFDSPCTLRFDSSGIAYALRAQAGFSGSGSFSTKVGDVMTIRLEDLSGVPGWIVENYETGIAYLQRPNAFTDLQQWSEGASVDIGQNGISFGNDGNFFNVNITEQELWGIRDNVQAGTVVFFRFVADTYSSVVIKDATTIQTASWAAPIDLKAAGVTKLTYKHQDVLGFIFMGSAKWMPISDSTLLARVKALENKYANTWTALSLTSDWQTGSSLAPKIFQYKIDSDGFVHIRGDLDSVVTAGNGDTHVADLPPEATPVTNDIAIFYPQHSGQSVYHIRLLFRTNGELIISDETGNMPAVEGFSLNPPPYDPDN